MTGSAIGPAVRKCREDYAFTPDRLAEMASISLPRVREIEEGAVPNIRELYSLAAALGVEPSALRKGNPVEDIKRSGARFRSALGATTLDPMDVRLLARAAEAGRICGFLGRLLGLTPSPVAAARSVVPIRAGSPPWKQGYDLGQKARSKLAPTRDPIVSMQALLEDLGVHVASTRFVSADIEAASVYEADAAPVILLNVASARVRETLPRRAALAHELCHLLHDGGERDLLTAVSRPEDHLDYERRANGFAPSFIAPGKWVKLPASEPSALVLQLGYTWGFSYEGAVWHAKNLKLISSDKAEELRKAPRIVGADNFEPEVARRDATAVGIDQEPTPLSSGLLSDRVVRALSEGLISVGRAREILSLA
jgi:Zn-dependent peptidase ImmA (M78 family)/transcriptional regulator with XRE-family HTH domain